MSVNEHRPCRDVVKTREQRHECRLSSAAGPDERDDLAGLRLEGHRRQYFNLPLVGIHEVHVVKSHVTKDGLGRNGDLRIADLWDGIKQLEDPARGADGLLKAAIQLHKPTD